MLSKTAYEASHPSALAMYCSDGRFTNAVEELLGFLGYERLDTLTIPGGPGHLAPESATPTEILLFSDAASFLISAHHISHVVLLAHDHCGHYGHRFKDLNEAALRLRQEADLLAARQTLIDAHPGLDVRCFFATPDSGRVRFDEVL